MDIAGQVRDSLGGKRAGDRAFSRWNGWWDPPGVLLPAVGYEFKTMLALIKQNSA